MADQLNWSNKLFFGDNLEIMRDHIADESVDLVYLDPPFNSKASYNVLFHEKDGKDSPAQITAFEDTWGWDQVAEATYWEIVKDGPQKLADLIQALRQFLGSNDMLAYLCMMAIRLVEMRRVLKSSGCLWLHCDPTASHYLKLVLDAVFEPKNYANEIVWKRTTAHSDSGTCGRTHDVLFLYAKDIKRIVWNKQFQEYDESYIESHYRNIDDRGQGPPLSDE
jgi:site-specific DNA-methyltransferase (adenine-specific)